MRVPTELLAAGTVTGALIAGLGTPAAGATSEWGLNGTYTATSNGEWAKTNEVFRDQDSIRGIWTINTDCSYPGECTGTVSTDWGWSAPIYQKSGIWYVKRTVENWQPCPDGTAGPGMQTFKFTPAALDGGGVDLSSTTFLGEDQTLGVSGSCGSSKSIFIAMPFKLVKTV